MLAMIKFLSIELVHGCRRRGVGGWLFRRLFRGSIQPLKRFSAGLGGDQRPSATKMPRLQLEEFKDIGDGQVEFILGSRDYQCLDEDKR